MNNKKKNLQDFKFRLRKLPSSLIAAHKVPPVAIRSSMTRIFSPGCTAPTCISILSVPYSREYSSEMTSPDGPQRSLASKKSYIW